jgi:hypothetical protein
MAVDNLPCELPRAASIDFGETLMPFIPAIAAADLSVPFDECNLPAEIKSGVILYGGKLTPDFEYMKQFLPT